eukprot:TRINITY_DN3316_c0_g2_i25.p1 TRINITY_DN3316_c0_g2~~TRINITY_DN3316_c0_g2_i25.p1  ORF type:complete len:121 (+),score=20.49 TRINITY_DN3316_c0_g2_i25:614-976(+)
MSSTSDEADGADLSVSSSDLPELCIPGHEPKQGKKTKKDAKEDKSIPPWTAPKATKPDEMPWNVDKSKSTGKGKGKGLEGKVCVHPTITQQSIPHALTTDPPPSSSNATNTTVQYPVLTT